MEAACSAGFGGATRPKLFPRLVLFAELIAQWERQQNAKLCTENGHRFSQFDNEFMDGKMDGSFMCAEDILRRNNE
jgi:hypothetical protein